jgi:isocitrate dehydrogenase
LGLEYRDETEDQVTIDAAEATKRLKVAVKCATITPNMQRVEEYHLKKMWKSPNATIRAALDGTVFRAPIMTERVKPCVASWEKPITIARHAYGDVYKGTEYRVPGPGKAELLFTGENGESFRETVYDFECGGVLQALYNKDSSIEAFARACFEFSLSEKQDLWFSTKDTISKQYDQTFKLIFQRIFDEEYKEKFEKAGIEYFYTLIDDAVARVIRSKGGFIWACKNYDGDVMSDMVSTAFGSLAMMTSALVSPYGYFEYEAAHGTVTKHYYRHLKGESTSTNPVATIFAWSGALKKRGELDGNEPLVSFAEKLENACIDTINSGTMTGDLAALCKDSDVKKVDTAGFIAAVRNNLEALM